MLIIEAYAKLNLCLAVKGKRGSMHLLDGVYTATDAVSDTVAVTKRNDGLVTVKYSDGRSYAHDTAYFAAKEIVSRYALGGADIFIDKRIPESRGLGGSSADAGAVARVLDSLYKIGGIDNGLLVGIGSDVPFCYAGGNKRVCGTGEILTDVVLPKEYCVLLVPNTGVSTADCFREYDLIGGDEVDVDGFLKGIAEGKPRYGNALLRAAQSLNPSIAVGLRLLKEIGFESGMTGSGSALFGTVADKTEFLYKSKKLKDTVPCGFTVYGIKE